MDVVFLKTNKILSFHGHISKNKNSSSAFLELPCYKEYNTLEDSLQMKTFETQDNKQDLPMNYIVTPGFNTNYKANETCVWHINGKNGTGEFEVNFQYLELEKSKGCLYDYVRVYKKGHGQHDWDQVGCLCFYN